MGCSVWNAENATPQAQAGDGACIASHRRWLPQPPQLHCAAPRRQQTPFSPVEVGAVVLRQLILVLKVGTRCGAVEPRALVRCHGCSWACWLVGLGGPVSGVRRGFWRVVDLWVERLQACRAAPGQQRSQDPKERQLPERWRQRRRQRGRRQQQSRRASRGLIAL